MFKLFMDQKTDIVQRTIRYRPQHVGVSARSGGGQTSRGSLMDTGRTVWPILHQHSRLGPSQPGSTGFTENSVNKGAVGAMGRVPDSPLHDLDGRAIAPRPAACLLGADHPAQQEEHDDSGGKEDENEEDCDIREAKAGGWRRGRGGESISSDARKFGLYSPRRRAMFGGGANQISHAKCNYTKY